MFQQQIVQHLEKIESRVETYSRESMSIERESLALFKEFVQQTTNFNSQVLELLKNNSNVQK